MSYRRNFTIFGLGYFDFDTPVRSPLVSIGNWVFLWDGPFALKDLGGPGTTASIAAFFLYMVAFMDTTATIPTSAMAERWKWSSFVSWGLFCGAVYYPLFGAWTWGGGWLNQLGNNVGLGFGYVDFARSGSSTPSVVSLASPVLSRSAP